MITHIAGTGNVIADALSHLQMEHYKQLILNAVGLATQSHPCMAIDHSVPVTMNWLFAAHRDQGDASR